MTQPRAVPPAYQAVEKLQWSRKGATPRQRRGCGTKEDIHLFHARRVREIEKNDTTLSVARKCRRARVYQPHAPAFRGSEAVHATDLLALQIMSAVTDGERDLERPKLIALQAIDA
jgi:hypothetical protein